jgi:hypothetical protein
MIRLLFAGATVLAAMSAAPMSAHAIDTSDRFAVVESNGTLARGYGAKTSKLGLGLYEVAFNRVVTKCAYTATLGRSDTTSQLVPGSIAVTGRVDKPRAIVVRTFDQAGAPTDMGFHVYVACRPPISQ